MEPSFLCCGKRWQITVSRFPSRNLLIQNINKELIEGHVVDRGKYTSLCINVLREARLGPDKVSHVPTSNNIKVTIDRIAIRLISF